MTRILITGANGFIGKNLIKSLLRDESKYEIHTILRDPNAIIDNIENKYFVDLTNLESLKKTVFKIDPNIIIHLAYLKNRDDQSDILNHEYYLNLQISSNIIQSSRLLSSLEKFIFFGSCDEYGIQNEPYREDQLEQPLTSYGLSKLSITKMLKALYYKENFPSLIIRPSVVYGEGQETKMFLPALANAVKNNISFDMTMGEQYRDYIYVEDLVEAIIILLSKKNLKLGEIINITYGKSFKLKEIAVKLANFIYDNGESILKIGNIDYRDTEVMNYHTSNKKVKDLLGWYPKTNLTIGLKKFSSLF